MTLTTTGTIRDGQRGKEGVDGDDDDVVMMMLLSMMMIMMMIMV
jgi:hypothetical protein